MTICKETRKLVWVTAHDKRLPDKTPGHTTSIHGEARQLVWMVGHDIRFPDETLLPTTQWPYTGKLNNISRWLPLRRVYPMTHYSWLYNDYAWQSQTTCPGDCLWWKTAQQDTTLSQTMTTNGTVRQLVQVSPHDMSMLEIWNSWYIGNFDVLKNLIY